MDILIRDIDPSYIKEIDKRSEELTEKLGRNFSRNEYIKMLIQNDCELRLTKLKEDKFDHVVDNLVTTLSRQEKTLQNFINSNNRLFHMLATGIDLDEGAEKL
ncbi:hypothetical protein ABZ787_12990 [Micrococcus luteus]|uniref:Uncharacterized protein n=1 Tax=Niallia taxi TaxID=2499688 RepID=A0A437K3P1_9BACI|nr:hypothetical protein [Niallia taxi]MDK8643288.1 hypothetical protein [Niallia taxi]MED4055204.1 hypothetical protein [Niallia taxi]RVT57010.1 hypothetical protein EM808_25745 [Niallia taxi]